MPEYIYDVFHGGQDFEHRKICGDGVMIDNGGRLCVYLNRAPDPTTTVIIAVFNMWNYYTMSAYKPEKTEPEQTKEQNG